MPLFIIPEWLRNRKILKNDLLEVQQLFLDNKNPVLGDLSDELLKHYYQTKAKVLFYKVVRVLGFYGIVFSGKLSAYSGPLVENPELLSIASKHHQKKITDYIGMPGSALLKSCGIETFVQLHGVPILSLKKLLDCIPSFEDLLTEIPATIVPAVSDFFSSAENEGDVQRQTKVEVRKLDDIYYQSINILNLSVRPYNCLVKKGIATIGDLVSLHPEDLLNTKNFGRKSLREISKKLLQLNLHLGSETKKITLPDQVKITEERYNLSLEVLNLSVRATNCLKGSKITTVGQLMQLSNHDLLTLPNLGRNTLLELMEKIANVRTGGAMPAQLSLFARDNKLGLDLDDRNTLANLSTSTRNLILTVRTQNVLNSQHIEYVWQIVQMTENKLRKFKNFGKKSLSELKYKLSELDLHLGITFTPEQIEKILSFEEIVSAQDLSTRFVQIIEELQNEKIPFLGKRENQIVHERLWPVAAKKRTLEEIASDLSTSRERIRQIENTSQQKILLQYRKDLHNILKIITQEISSRGGLTAISLLPLKLYSTALREQQIITELFSLVNDTIFLDWKFDLISGKGENWLNQICSSIKRNVKRMCSEKLFSRQILNTAVNQVISQYNLNGTTVTDLLINKVKEREKITSSGDLLCFGRMTKQDKAVIAFKNYFPEGLEIHKQRELLLKTFKEHAPETYYSTSPRSVIARLADHPDIFLWGRGFYVHRETVIFDSNLVDHAADWIIHHFDQGHPKFQINLPFHKFEEVMLRGGIPNEYALYTLIRDLNIDRIGQRKFPSVVDRLSEVDINETVVEELDNYLLAAKGVVQATELKREFINKRGWKDYRLQLQLTSHSENAYPWVNQSYIHQEYLPVNHDKLDELIDAIRSKLATINGAYSLKGAKQELQVLWHQVCPNAPIPTMVKLIRSVNSTDLEINHYLVSLRNDEGVETISLAAEMEDFFMEENREISTLELKKEFQEKRGWSDNQYYGAIRKSTLFQMSKTSFVHPATIGWNSELYEEVHTVLSENLHNKNKNGIPHIILSEIIDEYILPELPNGIEWTKELLISTGGEHNNFLFFDDACTFAENQFNIEDLDDMIAFLMSQSFKYNLAKQKKVERLLWREGIIASGWTIPKSEVFFPESSITYLPDSDEITLSQIGEERYGSQKPA